jgi:hypothetical protein
MRTGSDDEAVDVTLIRWMLSLSPEERLDVLQGFVDSIFAISDRAPARLAAPGQPAQDAPACPRHPSPSKKT